MDLVKQLSESQIEQIALATEDILENVGFRITHKKLQQMAKTAGAVVDEQTNTIRLPADLLRELISQVPGSYTISGSGGQKYVVGGDERLCTAIVTDPWIIDYKTQKPRHPSLEDLRRHTIVAQTLDEVACVSVMDYPVTDVPGPYSNLRALEEHHLNFNKHIFALPVSPESLERYLKIGNILLRGNSLKGSGLMTIGVAIVSPLTLTDLNVELLFKACEYGFAVVPTTCPMAGTTSPYSLASTLLQGNAESVFLAAITQIVNKGNPYLYAFGPSRTDMRSGSDLYYTFDKVLWKLAGAHMAAYYGMPSSVECGGATNAEYDIQCGAESMMFMLSAYASGAGMLSGIGSCYNANGMSGEMMLMQTAWMEAAKYFNRGITFDDMRLGIDNIKQTGPGGNFLVDDMTIEFLHGGEFISHDLLDFAGGHNTRYSMLDRAHDKLEEMVAGFTSPVQSDVQEELRSFFDIECGKGNAK